MPSVQPISPLQLPTWSSENELLCKFANICKSILSLWVWKLIFFKQICASVWEPLQIGWRRHSLTFCLVIAPSSRCQHGSKLRRSAKSKSALFHVNKEEKAGKSVNGSNWENTKIKSSSLRLAIPLQICQITTVLQVTALHCTCACAKPSSTLFSLNKRGEELARV